MLDLRRLTVLRAVARARSISGAARALDYTQPAISHHIARLEEEVGTPLLHRTSRGVRLTEAGEALVAHADAVLARLAAAQDEVAEIAGLRSGRVRVAAFPSGSATLIPAAARMLKQAHPGVSVSLIEAEPPEAVELLRTGEVDLALTFGYPETAPSHNGELDFEPLFEDPLFLVLPADEGLPSSLAELRDETWITGCERCRAHLLYLAAQAGFQPRIAYATDDYVTVQSLVAAGLGVTMLPSLALRAHRRADIRVVALGAEATRQVAVVALAGPRRPPAVTAMIDVLRTVSATDHAVPTAAAARDRVRPAGRTRRTPAHS